MENQSLLLTLTVGTVFSFLLFFVFYLGLKLNTKLSSLLTILITQAIYIPLAALYWDGLDVFAIHFAFFTMVPYGLGMITSQRDAQRRLDKLHNRAPTRTGWFHWGPATIIGFFLVLACVDALIITLASKGASPEFVRQFLPEPRSGNVVSSAYPGAVSHDFKEKYDKFNNYVAQLKAQDERGWKVSEGWQAQPVVGKETLFKIRLTDKNGNAVTQGNARVMFLRRSDQTLDKTLTLTETAPGQYGVAVNLPKPGAWDLVITIQQADKTHEVKGNTWVNPAS